MSTAANTMFLDSAAAPTATATIRSSADYWGPRLAGVVVLLWLSAFKIGFVAALGMITVLALAATLFGILRPTVGLFGIGILCTVDALTRVYLMTGGWFRWNTFNYALLLLMMASLPLLLRHRDVHTRLLQMLMILLAAELVFSIDLEKGVQHVLNCVTMFGLMSLFLRGGKDASAWYWLAAINGLCGLLGGLVFYLQQDSLEYIDRNALAYFPLTALFSICLAFQHTGARRKGQLFLGSLGTANFFWVFLTSSRGAILIGAFCMLSLAGSIRGFVRRAVIIGLAMGIGSAVFALFGDLQQNSVDRINKMLDSSQSASARTSGRIDLAVGAWYMFLERPLGVGTGSFAWTWAEVSSRLGLRGPSGKHRSAHSGWMKILAENGLPGITLFAAYVFSFAFVGWLMRKRGMLSAGLLATGVLGTAFLSTEFAGKGLWFLAAGTTVLLYMGRTGAISLGTAGYRGDEGAFAE